jgi:DNA-binding MarR family transcriptional regulator
VQEINNGIRIVKVFKRVGHLIKQSMDKQFGDIKLTGPQGMLLGILAHDGEMKISDLSEKLGLSNSTVSGIIDRLEKQALVERIRSSEDRRVVYVNVTEKYRREFKEKFYKLEKYFEESLSTATPEEADMIIKGIDKLEEVLRRREEQILRRREEETR